MAAHIIVSAPDPDDFFAEFLDVEPDGPARAWRDWWQARGDCDATTRLAAECGFVLTPAQLAGLGVSRSAYRYAARRGRWSHPGVGAFAPVDVRIDAGAANPAAVVARRRHALVVSATALRRPGHAASGRSAALLHGLPTVAIPDQPEFTDPRAVTLGHRECTHVYGATLPLTSCATWFGVRVTTVARTLIDLARHDADRAIMATDAALRESLVTQSQIDAELNAARGWPGIRRARAVLALAAPLAESPIESVLRLRLHDDGFPPVQLQVWIAGYRVDCYIEAYNLVIEADGRVKYTADERTRENDERWREKHREHRIRTAGPQVERVIWADLFGRNWVRTSDRLRSHAPTSRRLWSRPGPES